MYSHDELKSLHAFLKSTNEGNLKKMLVGGKMSETHLRMLVKIARSANEADFLMLFESAGYPKIKFAPAESALKEQFWPVITEACAKVGLLTSAAAQTKKAA